MIGATGGVSLLRRSFLFFLKLQETSLLLDPENDRFVMNGSVFADICGKNLAGKALRSMEGT